MSMPSHFIIIDHFFAIIRKVQWFQFLCGNSFPRYFSWSVKKYLDLFFYLKFEWHFKVFSCMVEILINKVWWAWMQIIQIEKLMPFNSSHFQLKDSCDYHKTINSSWCLWIKYFNNTWLYHCYCLWRSLSIISFDDSQNVLQPRMLVLWHYILF